jgi:hypothetical protein
MHVLQEAEAVALSRLDLREQGIGPVHRKVGTDQIAQLKCSTKGMTDFYYGMTFLGHGNSFSNRS